MKVVLTHSFLPEVIRRELGSGTKLVLARSPAALRRELRDADALITAFSDPVNEALLRHAPRLRVVGNYAVGVNNIDLKACRTRGIRVVNTPNVLTRATAELTIALLFAVARRVYEGELLCRSGKFKGWEADLLLGLELKGRSAVLVGRGRIGTETARMLKGLGIRVTWITRKDGTRAIERKLRQAQILSLHIPLTPNTHHWLNRRRLSLLPKDAIVLNTTRGPTIDERALIASLKAKRIFGAGLDVYEREPAIPRELRALSNTILLPHVGSATRQAREGMAALVAQGVRAILAGKHPWNEVE